MRFAVRMNDLLKANSGHAGIWLGAAARRTALLALRTTLPFLVLAALVAPAGGDPHDR